MPRTCVPPLTVDRRPADVQELLIFPSEAAFERVAAVSLRLSVALTAGPDWTLVCAQVQQLEPGALRE